MKKLHFTCTINATAQTVWSVLWSPKTYPEWTAVFSPGSHVESDWKQGSKVLFLDADKKGIVSRIAEMRVNEYLSFEHYGEYNNGVEDTTSDSVKSWAGAQENYILTEKNDTTELKVEIDITEGHEAYFQKHWPVAMEKIKEIAER